jgi:cell wall-associated NlpC family hydrolase
MSGAVPRPFPSPDWTPPASASAPSAAADNRADTPGAPIAPIALPEPIAAAPDASASAPSASADKTAAEPDAPLAPDLTSRRFDGRAVAQFALGFRGVPYRPGGTDPSGFDCSGLVQYVFAQYGIIVPRVAEQQYEAGDKIRPSEIKPGDLLFFATKRRNGASHVGIAIGGEQFVHAPNSIGVVRIETLSSTYWGSRYVGARRITASHPNTSD